LLKRSKEKNGLIEKRELDVSIDRSQDYGKILVSTDDDNNGN